MTVNPSSLSSISTDSSIKTFDFPELSAPPSEDPSKTKAIMPDDSTCTPTKPTIGGLVVYSKSEQVAWTGAISNKDLAGLETNTAPTSPRTPNCLRPNYASGKAKNWNKRIKAATRLFKKVDPTYLLHTFDEDQLEHLEDCGMETIFYVPAITVTAKMASVIQNKDRFTLLHVQDEQKNI
jgi:hypothetical protein